MRLSNVLLLVLILALMGCAAPTQVSPVTVVPSATILPSPTATLTPTPTLTPEPTSEPDFRAEGGKLIDPNGAPVLDLQGNPIEAVSVQEDPAYGWPTAFYADGMPSAVMVDGKAIEPVNIQFLEGQFDSKFRLDRPNGGVPQYFKYDLEQNAWIELVTDLDYYRQFLTPDDQLTANCQFWKNGELVIPENQLMMTHADKKHQPIGYHDRFDRLLNVQGVFLGSTLGASKDGIQLLIMLGLTDGTGSNFCYPVTAGKITDDNGMSSPLVAKNTINQMDYDSATIQLNDPWEQPGVITRHFLAQLSKIPYNRVMKVAILAGGLGQSVVDETIVNSAYGEKTRNLTELLELVLDGDRPVADLPQLEQKITDRVWELGSMFPNWAGLYLLGTP